MSPRQDRARGGPATCRLPQPKEGRSGVLSHTRRAPPEEASNSSGGGPLPKQTRRSGASAPRDSLLAQSRRCSGEGGVCLAPLPPKKAGFPGTHRGSRGASLTLHVGSVHPPPRRTSFLKGGTSPLRLTGRAGGSDERHREVGESRGRGARAEPGADSACRRRSAATSPQPGVRGGHPSSLAAPARFPPGPLAAPAAAGLRARCSARAPRPWAAPARARATCTAMAVMLPGPAALPAAARRGRPRPSWDLFPGRSGEAAGRAGGGERGTFPRGAANPGAGWAGSAAALAPPAAPGLRRASAAPAEPGGAGERGGGRRPGEGAGPRPQGPDPGSREEGGAGAGLTRPGVAASLPKLGGGRGLGSALAPRVWRRRWGRL